MINDLVKENERVDDLQNGYYIIQDPRKFCFGMDAVLLSGFARVKKGEKVLDMGTGTGIIPVLLLPRLWESISQVWKSRKSVLKWQQEV